MSWTKLAVLLLLLVIIFTMSAFGSHFGFTVHGVPAVNPDIWDFIGAMATFSIDGLPALFSYVFYICIAAVLYIIVTAILPGGGG